MLQVHDPEARWEAIGRKVFTEGIGMRFKSSDPGPRKKKQRQSRPKDTVLGRGPGSESAPSQGRPEPGRGLGRSLPQP